MNRVLDAGPMIAFLDREEGWDVVRAMLEDPDDVCFAHSLNLCEVFYQYRRAGGGARAEEMIERLFASGVEIREDMDVEFWYAIGRLKSDPPRKSIADCCGLALAVRLGGEFVTTDHHELDRCVPLGICPIRFIR